MADPLAVRSREYKVVLDHRLFGDSKSAIRELGEELRSMAARLRGIDFDGGFKQTKQRTILFLDTPDESIRYNGLVFRQRTELARNKTEYTLKCRSPDRYVAAGANVGAADHKQGEVKLEEDISSPFVSRFSHSGTVPGPGRSPKNLKAGGSLFPALLEITRDGKRCSDKLPLQVVNAMQIFERVVTGPVVDFDGTQAEVALILWSQGAKGRPLIGEFSFRLRHKKEAFNAKCAKLAMTFFQELQTLDWCLPDGRTKTQYAYRQL